MLLDLQFRIKINKPLLHITTFKFKLLYFHLEVDMEIQHTENY